RGGGFVVGPPRQPDAQSPAGGVSSSVNDMAKWMAFVLANGVVGGQPLVPAAALLPALSPQIVSNPAGGSGSRAGFYGYGFNVGTSAAGRVTLGHSGAFLMGAATAFSLIPSADVGIVVLTNAWPIGVPETLVAQFNDLVQFGSIQRDWGALAAQSFAPFHLPSGSLVGVPRPAQPAPSAALASYAGTYQNPYYGPLQVVENGGALALRLGPAPLVLPLTHWDGDVFTFTLDAENAATGTISKASFAGDRVVLEYYDGDGLGTFRR
ncbi:MAG: serine hydrolase, partial [Burkholderiaceae bacterium]